MATVPFVELSVAPAIPEHERLQATGTPLRNRCAAGVFGNGMLPGFGAPTRMSAIIRSRTGGPEEAVLIPVGRLFAAAPNAFAGL